jgi:hypothetical protein
VALVVVVEQKVVMPAALLLQLHKHRVNTELYKDTQAELA